MTTPTDRDLARHRRAISRTLSRHFESPAVQWGLRAVERELFRYKAGNGLKYQHWLGGRMKNLATAVTALDVIQRVVECYALRRDEERGTTFPNQRCWLAFVARKVFKQAHCKILVNSNAARLADAGRLIEDVLGSFAMATLMRMDKDAAADRAARGALEAFASGAP